MSLYERVIAYFGVAVTGAFGGGALCCFVMVTCTMTLGILPSVNSFDAAGNVLAWFTGGGAAVGSLGGVWPMLRLARGQEKRDRADRHQDHPQGP